MAVSAHLRKLAKKASILEGAATLYMLPFATPYTQQLIESVQNGIPPLEDGDINNFSHWNTFVLIEAYTVDLDIHQQNPYTDILSTWWEMRQDSYADRYTVFSACVPFKLTTILFDAYKNTRQELPQPSQILMEGAPVLDGSPLVVSDTVSGGKP